MILNLINKLLRRSDIYINHNLYMRRWRIGPRNFIGIRLHHILQSDNDRWPHDHPFDFISIILKGGYIEHQPDGSSIYYGPGSIIVRKAEDLHQLELLDKPTWTLVIRGKIRRKWGYMTDSGWIPWHVLKAPMKGNYAEEW